jgi:tetratricopeptide (TPR) repeat protein
MGAASQPENLKKSWISEHPLVVIGVILAGCLGPFINKAIHMDDPLFVWAGQWIQKHPGNFYGSEVDWWASTIPMWIANYNPPLLSYFLAGVASLFGWHEIALHLACLVVAFTAAAGIYSLAQMWCARPLLATVVAIFTPAFLVSSTTLMCDVLMLAFWIWALVLWERALGSAQSRWQYVGAGVLAGLAVLTKYSAVTLLPLLPVLTLLRTRKLGWWLVGLAVPLGMVLGYEWLTAEMYGRGLLSGASYYARTVRALGDWQARGIIGLAFAGGSLLPLLFFAPWLWRRWVWLAGGLVIFGVWLGLFEQWNNLGLPRIMPLSMSKHWDFLLQVAILIAGGLHLLLLVVAEVWRRRNPISVMLVLWIMSGLFFAAVLNWTVCARSFLPMVPAAVILLVRRLEAMRGNAVTWGLLWPLIPAAAVTLGLVMADYQLANSARTAAEQIMAKYKTTNRTVWFEGHMGFQYYMERLGGRPIDVERSLLQPDDVVVVPEIGIFIALPPDSVGWVEQFHYVPSSWMNLMWGVDGKTAGFYTINFGPVPFVIGKLPPQNYDVVKILSRLQFNSQPTNRREVEAGVVPSFSGTSGLVQDETVPPVNPEAMRRYQIALQLEKDGKLPQAIQSYRESLQVEPDNPIVLNRLAWILATAGNPELRNGKEAVQLATKAVELTEYRQPLSIETLAAAYAEAGDFSHAAEMANTARVLALITGQDDVAGKCAELLTLYSSGRTVDAIPAP